MNPKDAEKTGFDTKYCQFEYMVMPLGLCSAPATSEPLMNRRKNPPYQIKDRKFKIIIDMFHRVGSKFLYDGKLYIPRKAVPEMMHLDHDAKISGQDSDTAVDANTFSEICSLITECIEHVPGEHNAMADIQTRWMRGYRGRRCAVNKVSYDGVPVAPLLDDDDWPSRQKILTESNKKSLENRNPRNVHKLYGRYICAGRQVRPKRILLLVPTASANSEHGWSVPEGWNPTFTTPTY